mmetsp:Transcript_11386/g.24026  ORF Transcript_11386/g.24026 Transcript_11386/m.24026 type:complete len:202 (-) Transcript_11386:2471-3076(-)
MKLSTILSFLALSLAATPAAAAAASEDNAVFRGVADDDGAAIRSAVANDPSLLESIGPGGQTPLIHAVLTGKEKAVTTLLELGADTSATERDGYDVLHAAGFQGRAGILTVLLEEFAKEAKAGGFSLDPSTDRHRDGFYPMHRACWGSKPGHTDTVKVFLEHGVPFDLTSKQGNTCEEMTRNEETKAVLSMFKKGIEANEL